MNYLTTALLAAVVIIGLGILYSLNTAPGRGPQRQPVPVPPVGGGDTGSGIEEPVVTNFEECVAAGNPVMESYPRQCRHQNTTYVEDREDDIEQRDSVLLFEPQPNEAIQSPLTITGEARGPWFFEANFPIVLTDQDGRVIAEHFATAQSEWMTESFVPFSATLLFEAPAYLDRGSLILHKANPSGLPEHDAMLEVPIRYAQRNSEEEMSCPEEARNVDACIQVYNPVCGKVNVQCITEPCNPVYQTFGNSCEACRNQLVESYTEGACE